MYREEARRALTQRRGPDNAPRGTCDKPSRHEPPAPHSAARPNTHDTRKARFWRAMYGTERVLRRHPELMLVAILQLSPAIAAGLCLDLHWRDQHMTQRQAQLQLDSVDRAVTTWRLDRLERGRVPRAPTNLNETGEAPRDPWGAPVVYRRTGAFDYVLFSAGPDGIAHTSDDVYPLRRKPHRTL